MIKINNRTLKLLIYGYLYINIFTFLLGYLKIYISIPVSLICAAAIYIDIRKTVVTYFEVSRRTIVISSVVIGFMMLAAGHGGLCRQLPDWSARNAILHDLIDKPWPVYYNDGSALSYYTGYFMVFGALGKLIGFQAAYWAMYLYGVAGLEIVYILLIKNTKANTLVRQLVVLMMLCMFSNCEDIKNIVNNIVVGIGRYINPDYQLGGGMIGYTPFYLLYAGVFNQIIPAFVVLAAFLDNDSDLSAIALLCVPLIIYSPFQLLFLTVLVIIAFVKMLKNKGLKDAVSNIFTLRNVMILAALTPILILYLWGNITGDKPEVLQFHMIKYSNGPVVYIAFIITQVCLYAGCLYRKYKKDVYFYAACIGLIILPLFQMGLYNDLCTRTSAVGLFIFMVYIIKYWFECDFKIRSERIISAVLAVLVLMSAIKPMNEAKEAVIAGTGNFANHSIDSSRYEPFSTLEGVKNQNQTDLTYNFFAFNAKDEIFFKYLTRK